MEHSGVKEMLVILIVVVAAQLYTSVKTRNHMPKMCEFYSI